MSNLLTFAILQLVEVCASVLYVAGHEFTKQRLVYRSIRLSEQKQRSTSKGKRPWNPWNWNWFQILNHFKSANQMIFQIFFKFLIAAS